MSRSERPLISILIPTYNRLSILKDTLHSVLNQGEPLAETEILISSDASTDGTKEWLEAFQREHKPLRIRIFNHGKNLGGPGNWAFLLDEAQGEFVFLLSDDDWIAPTFLERYMSVLRQGPDIDLIYSAIDYRSEDMKPLSVGHLSSIVGRQSGPERLKNQLRANHMVMSTMYRTSLLRDAGGWQGRYGVHLDGAAFSRSALRARQTYFIDEPLFIYRIGAQTWSSFRIEKQKHNYLCYRHIIDDVIEDAQALHPELLSFLRTRYAGHAQAVLNILDLKMIDEKLALSDLKLLLRDLRSVYPEVRSLSSYYKLILVSHFGAGWLTTLRKALNKPDLRQSEGYVFENQAGEAS